LATGPALQYLPKKSAKSHPRGVDALAGAWLTGEQVRRDEARDQSGQSIQSPGLGPQGSGLGLSATTGQATRKYIQI